MHTPYYILALLYAGFIICRLYYMIICRLYYMSTLLYADFSLVWLHTP